MLLILVQKEEEVVKSVAPQETHDGYAFQVSDNASAFNF